MDTIRTSIGQKIKSLRTRRNISQLDLETTIDAGPGSISRIENDKVNPTKETLLQISDALQLTPFERTYLLGLTDKTPTLAEISHVVEQFRPLLDDPNNYGYVIDQYSRLQAISKGFRSMIQTPDNPDAFIGKTVLELVFLPEIGLRNFLAEESLTEVATSVVAFMHSEREHLLNEPVFKEIMERVSKSAEFQAISQKVLAEKPNIYSPEMQRVTFELAGQQIPMEFRSTSYHADPRFSYVEYRVLSV